MRIGYIHGYNGSHNGHSVATIRKYLPEDWEIVGMEYDEKTFTCMEVRKKIFTFVAFENIDILIGTSLGGFYISTITNVPKVLINPCMDPIEELSALGCQDREWLQSFSKFIDYAYFYADTECKMLTKVFIGTDDRALGNKYANKLMKYYDLQYVNCGHKINDEAAKIIVKDMTGDLIKKMKSYGIFDSIMNNLKDFIC